MYDDHHDLRILTTAPTSSTPVSFIGGIPEEEWEDDVGPIAGRKDDAWGSIGTPRMQTNSKDGWGSGGGWPGPAHTPVSGGTPKSVPHRKADMGWGGREASAAVNNRDWGDGHNDRGGWGHHDGGGHGGGSAGPDRWVDQYDDDEDDEGEAWGEPSQPSFGPSTQGGWMSWGEEARKLTSKVMVSNAPNPPHNNTAGTRAPVSQQQHSQIVNSLLNRPNQNNNNQQHRWSGAPPNGTPKGWDSQLDAGNRMQQQQEMRQLQLNQALQHQRQLDYQPHPQQQHPYQQHPQHPQHQQHQQQLGGMKNKKQKKLKTGEDQYSEVAGWGDEWGDRLGDTNHGENGWGNMEDRRVHFSPKVVDDYMVDTFRPQQESRTLSYARQGMDTSINNHPVHNQMQDHANVRFIESKGAALASVQQALFSDARPARSRFHWLFSSDKDERVRSLLASIQTVSYDLASFGVSPNLSFVTG